MTGRTALRPGLSILGTIARLSGPHQRGHQFGSLGPGRPLDRRLPADREREIAARLAPVLTRLQAERKIRRPGCVR